MITPWQILFVALEYLIYAAEILIVLSFIVLTLLMAELKLLTNGHCHDIYMFPFRWFFRRKRAELQAMVDSICEKINDRDKIEVKIYFFPGIIMGANLAFCIIPARTIFIQNWLLKNTGHEMLYFILCHEIGHIVKMTLFISDDSLLGEYAADEFAASITGTDAAIAALQKTKELIKLLKKNKNPEFDSLATSELDQRIYRLKNLGRKPISPPPSNAAP